MAVLHVCGCVFILHWSVTWSRFSLSALFVFFCKQMTVYDMRISDWSSDVCSSDLAEHLQLQHDIEELKAQAQDQQTLEACWSKELQANERLRTELATSQADLEAERDRRRLSDADLSRRGDRKSVV